MFFYCLYNHPSLILKNERYAHFPFILNWKLVVFMRGYDLYNAGHNAILPKAKQVELIIYKLIEII